MRTQLASLNCREGGTTTFLIRLVLLGAVIELSIASIALAQVAPLPPEVSTQEAVPTFQTETNEVLIPVNVFDLTLMHAFPTITRGSEMSPDIPWLSPRDFRIFEDGKIDRKESDLSVWVFIEPNLPVSNTKALGSYAMDADGLLT